MNAYQTPTSAQSTRQGDCLSQVVTGLVWLWIVVVTFGRYLFSATASLFMAQVPSWVQPVSPIVEVLLLGVPLGLLAWLWGNQRYRAVFQTWLAMTGFVLLLSPIFLIKPFDAQGQAILHILLALIYTGIVSWLGRGRRERGRRGSNRTAALAALAMAGLFAIPWLAWGAFGSLTDILLNLIAALAFGLAAAVTFDTILLPGWKRASSGASRDLLPGGFVMGTALVILASGTGFGFGVFQILLMLCIPPLGWAAMGLASLQTQGQAPGELSQASPIQGKSTRLAVTLLLGLAFAAPMTLIDPDELALIISLTPGEILVWASRAAMVSAGIAFVLSFVTSLLLATRGQRIQPDSYRSPGARSPILAVGAAAAWLLAIIVYFAAGRPGFYGEGIFVILKDQANVADAPQRFTDYNQRRQYVYQTLVQHANTTQAGIRAALDQFHIPYTPYYLENAIEVQGGPIIRLWMLTRPEVDRVLENPWLRPLPQRPPVQTGTLPAPTTPQWDLTLIHADQVWNQLGVTGKGIVIGQSDTGVQWDHPNLKDSYRGYDQATGKVNNDYNWYDPWANSTSPFDLEGHGTHTTGSIAGKFTGVAPGATWYACVNLERNLGNPSFYLDCMQFMLAPFPIHGNPLKDGDATKGAMVINNSWGCPDMEGCDPNALLPAVNALADAGVFVVVSAGNDGPSCDTIKDPPALYQRVVSVGAIDSAGALAGFSSLGPVTADGSGRIKPDLVAPGVAVISSMPDNTYAALDGTSMAGPHVVGVVALMWSANPALIGDIADTTRLLLQNTQPYRGPLPNCPKATSVPSSDVGYGIVDAYKAVVAAKGFTK